MAEEVDEFLASLDAFASPTIESAIMRLRQGSAAPAHTPSTPLARQEDRPAASDQHRRVPKRVREEEEHRRGDRYGVTQTGVPDIPAPFQQHRGSIGDRGVASSTWRCIYCTLINPACLSVCAACDHTRAEDGSTGLSCPKCTFINFTGLLNCYMCGMSLIDVPIQEGINFHVHTTDSARGDPPSTTVPRVQGCNSTQGVSTGGHPTNVRVEAQAAAYAGAESGTDPRVNSVSESTDSEEDSMSTESSSDDDDHNGNSLTNRELVEFLQTLKSVAADQLPCAVVPASMQAKGQLQPFQLQALHWLMSREEDHTPAPRPHWSNFASEEVSSSSAPSSSMANIDNDSFDTQNVNQLHVQSVRGGILADYMGLGKTRTMISLCESTRGPRYDRLTGSQVESSATLIVCPTSLMMQWRSEIKECVSPERRVLLYYGIQKKRLTLFDIAEKYDYVLTTYQSLRHEHSTREGQPGKLYMIRWARLILDEAHYIRNIRTLQCRACLQLTAVCRWAVTATPVQNSLNDLLPILKFLRVPYFSATEWWNMEIVRYLNIDPNHPRPVTALGILFASLLLRRTADTLVNGVPILNLPPKVVRTEEVRLSAEEKEFYDAVHQYATRKLDAVVGGRDCLSVFSTAFELLIRCRQSCLHPYIVAAALQRVHRNAQGEVESIKPDSEGTWDQSDVIKQSIQQFVDNVLARKLRGMGSEFVAQLIDELKKQKLDEHECTICLERVLRPAIMPCAHTFCGDCIRNALSISRRCPLCKRTCKVEDIVDVPTALISSSPDPASSHNLKSNHLFEKVNTEDTAQWRRLSSKTTCLLEAIQRISPDDKIVVFCSFVTYLHYLRWRLAEANIPCVLYTGSLSLKQKDDALKLFRGEDITIRRGPTASSLSDFPDEHGANALPQLRGMPSFLTAPFKKHHTACALVTGQPRVMLATTTACGVGLNLTCANHCFLMEPTWNPGVEAQALNRIHRIGQIKPVTVVKLLAKDTIEEKIDALCRRKEALSGYCFGSSQKVGASQRLRTEDLLELFANKEREESSESSTESSMD